MLTVAHKGLQRGEVMLSGPLSPTSDEGHADSESGEKHGGGRVHTFSSNGPCHVISGAPVCFLPFSQGKLEASLASFCVCVLLRGLRLASQKQIL